MNVECVLSGNSKYYLGKEFTEQQINEMDNNYISILSNKYESILSAQMTKSSGRSVINLLSNIACSVLGAGNKQDLNDDLECDPSLKGEFRVQHKLAQMKKHEISKRTSHH